MMRNGQVYELPMQERHTTDSESSSSPIQVLGTVTTATSGRSPEFRKGSNPNPVEFVEDLLRLPTPKARDAQAEGYEAGLRRSQPQVGTIVKGIVEGDPRITEDNLFRTPSVTDSTGGARSEKQAAERGQMVKTADQVVQLAFENGLKVSPAVEASLLPTPALGHIRNYDEPVEDYLVRRAKADSGEYRGMPGVSLGVAIRMELMPTPNTMDMLPARTPEQKAANKGKGGYANVRETVVNDLMPTPTTRDFKDGSAEHERDGVVQTDTVARAIFNSGEISDISWGKFEPAIRRWEQVLGRPAPAPTKPDGKDGAHRLSSSFTEWMMGLPEGWITGHGLSRNDELKMAGNGVVPQQAELALRILLEGIALPSIGGGQVNLPTPTVSDTYTDNLASTQQKPGSMHSVTLPQAVRGINA
jgi:hypothetical protein